MYLSDADLPHPVQLIFFEQSIGCETCVPTRQLLQQIAESNTRISLETLNLVLEKDRAAEYGIDRVPAIVITSSNGDRIRFVGAPLGTEVTSLLDAIRMTATGETTLTPGTRAKLKALSHPVDVKVFFTPTCVYCPRMIVLASQMAIESPFITVTAIDATEYPDLVHRFNVNGVPKTVVNDTVEILGAATEEALLAAIC